MSNFLFKISDRRLNFQMNLTMEKTILMILLVKNIFLNLKILIAHRKMTILMSLKTVIQMEIMKVTLRQQKRKKAKTRPQIKIFILLFTGSKNPIHIFKGLLIQTGRTLVMPCKGFCFSKMLSVV